eukprot:4102665-Pleurochrysis_carterae.AAC.1
MARVFRCSTSEGKRVAAELLYASGYCRSNRRRRIDLVSDAPPSRVRRGRFLRQPHCDVHCRQRNGRLQSTKDSLPVPLCIRRLQVRVRLARRALQALDAA